MESSQLFRPPETPCEPLDFLCRLSACELPKAIAHTIGPPPKGHRGCAVDTIHEEIFAASEKSPRNPLSFPSSDTCMLLMNRIMSHSQEVSPRTSGRLSHRSSPLNGSLSDSPPVSPSGIDHLKRPVNIPIGNYKVSVSGGGKTVGRWLKDRREKKKEELRAQNAQIHAAVSVAGVASAIAAIAAATAAANSGPGKDEQIAKTDLALASAATLVAAQCVEAAEAIGAERDHLTSVVRSAVNVRSVGDIMTLTAAAATALRAAATLKARSSNSKDVLNSATVIPVEKPIGVSSNCSSNGSGELAPDENFLDRDLLARGFELLKRTRKVDAEDEEQTHSRDNDKKKKNMVLELVKDIPAWPDRHLLSDGNEFGGYFGLKVDSGRVVEFECRNRKEFEVFTQGVERLLEIVAHKKKGQRI